MHFIQRIIENSIYTPNRDAIVVNHDKISYVELITAAKNLAIRMSAFKNTQSFCILLCDKSIFLYQTMLACFFGNYIYTPINIHAPLARNQKILEQLPNPLVVISTDNYDLIESLLPHLKSPTILVEGEHLYDKLYEKYDCFDIYLINEMEYSIPEIKNKYVDIDNAYLLFTSGSTGEPKGVLINYENINAYLVAITSLFIFKQGDKFSQVCDISFDLSLHEILVCLVTGGTLFVYHENHLHGVVKFLEHHKINHTLMVPSTIPLLVQQIEFFNCRLQSIRFFFFCGEPFPIQYARNLQCKIPHGKIINLYGPTEVTIACSYHVFLSAQKYQNSSFLPIGVPFPGIQFLVSKNSELHISGRQCFRGYLGNFVSASSEYQTGDAVSYDDNCYHFTSRIDDQWKVQGYRLEKADVEVRLRKIFNENNIYIAPKYLSSGLIERLVIFSDKVIDFLAFYENILAEFPAIIFIFKVFTLNEIPKLPNHKVDYRQLKNYANS